MAPDGGHGRRHTCPLPPLLPTMAHRPPSTAEQVPLKKLLPKEELCALVNEASEWVDEKGKHPFFLWRVGRQEAGQINGLILNKLSEQNWFGFVAQNAGIPVVPVDFVFGLCHERSANARFKKLRIFVIRKTLLHALFLIDRLQPDGGKKIQFERAGHIDRLKSLFEMARLCALIADC